VNRMSGVLLRYSRFENAASQGISRFGETTVRKQLGEYVGCNFDLVKQFFRGAQSGHDVNGKKLPGGTGVILNIDKSTFPLIHIKTTRRKRAGNRSRKQAYVESLPGAINERSCPSGLNEHPSAMAVLLGIALQRTSIPEVTCANTASSPVAILGALNWKSRLELPTLQNVNRSRSLTLVNQLCKFVSCGFNFGDVLLPNLVQGEL
jgi:hypothetical protein